MDQPSDIRNLSAHRSPGAPVVALRSSAQLRPDLRDAIEPIQRRFGRPQLVIREHTNNAVRWTAGEPLNHVLEEACIRFSESDAVMTDAGSLSYRELDCRANQVARYLIEQGIEPGDRVGLLFEKSAETYIAMLAVLKVNACYVPLDAAFPIERLRFIIADAEIKTIVSMSSFAERLAPLDVQKVFLDSAKRAIDKKDASRLTGVPRTYDPICYIIYTSGTTGNPKGVAIAQASICNFVRVAAELYGYQPGDRIYQGMTIAFDFSIEEIWVPLVAGATLVPASAGATLIGEELTEFLREREVTVMACCPTLLATIDQDLPRLRILLVGGEACPQNLVARWYRPGRRILNSYGPTEATVTATLTELKPDKPVTIGIPLSTYTIVILDPNEDKTVENGELGEIGIAGVGVALGYMNRDELTMKKFIPDFLNIRNNPSGRIYRTGDLGRIDENGDIEYRGRIDTQVKIRGYRIELNEIEAVLLGLPEIAQAAVTTFEPEPGVVELVAYYAPKQDCAPPRDQISQAPRRHPQERRDGGRVDARHLHASDPRKARLSPRRRGRRDGRDRVRTVPCALDAVLCDLRRDAGRLLCRLRAVRAVGAGCRLGVVDRREQHARSLRPQHPVRGGVVRRAYRHFDRREVVARRPLQGGHDPDLELRLFPLLGRAEHDALIAHRRFRRHAALHALPPPDGREDRPQCHHRLAAWAGLRRHDLDRRRHDPAQGHDRARLSRAVEFHPHRSGRDRLECLRRRSERHRYRHEDGRRHAARPRLVAAERPARARRQALSRLARGRDHVQLLPAREQERGCMAARGVQLRRSEER